MTWSQDELHKIAEADDLHVSPFRFPRENDCASPCHPTVPSKPMRRNRCSVHGGR